MNGTIRMPNGPEKWAQSLTEIALQVGCAMAGPADNTATKIAEDNGMLALHEWLIDLASSFEEDNAGREWDGEWPEVIEEFVQGALKTPRP